VRSVDPGTAVSTTMRPSITRCSRKSVYGRTAPANAFAISRHAGSTSVLGAAANLFEQLLGVREVLDESSYKPALARSPRSSVETFAAIVSLLLVRRPARP